MSKYMCFKCGKVRHIATNPKCPQYKKLVQHQIFATQVVNNRSENGQPNTDRPSEGIKELHDVDPRSGTNDK
jgi:hypothetical protein